MHHPTDRITHTTAFVTPVVEHRLEQKIAQWVFLDGEGYTNEDIQLRIQGTMYSKIGHTNQIFSSFNL